MIADRTPASSGLTRRSLSASVLLGAICSSGTSSPVVGSRYSVMPWWVSSRSSSQRMPVSLRTLDHGEAPERFFLLVGQVTALAGVGVLGPHPAAAVPWRATARRSVPPVPSMISPGGVATAAWRRRAVAFLRSAAVRARTGSTGSRSRVRWSIRALRRRAFLGPVDLGVADRARDCPLRPPSGLLDGPLGEVEVERPDGDQHSWLIRRVTGTGSARRRRW